MPGDVPGLFANIEDKKNLDFIKQWMHIGEDINVWYQFNMTSNYMSQLPPSPQTQSLWSLYDDNLFSSKGAFVVSPSSFC